MTTSTDRSGKHVLVNLGCGGRFNPNWLNYDLVPCGPGVKKANFIKGIPLADNSADVVYHSHVLEHMNRDDAPKFLGQCLRVLKPGGTLRVVVPDLEASARDYLDVLDRRRKGEPLEREHLWMLVEMLDQTVRVRRGGLMGRMMNEARDNPQLLDFVVPRLGSSGRSLRKPRSASYKTEGKYERMQKFLESFGYMGKMLSEVLFRGRGEIHRWMYDELYLSDVLKQLGYQSPTRYDAGTSGIPDWPTYGLDAEPDGSAYKGVSLYMEAVKPR